MLIVQNCEDIVSFSREISKNYWPDDDHYVQVRKLALELFDGLSKLHQFGARERCWLECAAILHDIGLSKSRGGHHKKSAKLILNETQLPFTSQERRIIASICSLPSQRFAQTKSLYPGKSGPRNYSQDKGSFRLSSIGR